METPTPRPPGRLQRAGLLLTAPVLILAQTGAGQRLLGLDRPGEIALAILIAAAILWTSEAVPLFVTSLLVLALELSWLEPALGDAGRSTGATFFLSPFFSDVTLLFLGGFVLSEALHKAGLGERLARAVLRRAGAAPSTVVLAIMLTTAGLSAWMSNTASTALMLALAGTLMRVAPEGDGLRKALVLAVPLAANLGGLLTPVGSPPNAIALRYLKEAGLAPSFAGWMMLALPPVALLLVLCWRLLLRLFPTHVRALHLLPPAGPPARVDRLVVGTALCTVLGWVTGDLHRLSPGTVALLPVVVLFGAGRLGTAELRALPWDVLLLVGGGLALGAGMERSGLAAWLVGHLRADTVPPALLLGAVTLLAGGLTAVMSNTAAANLVLPVLAGLPRDAQGPLMLAVAFACSLSMPLPVSTPPNAMAFGSGQITAADLIRPGSILTVLGLLLTLVAVPLGLRLLG